MPYLVNEPVAQFRIPTKMQSGTGRFNADAAVPVVSFPVLCQNSAQPASTKELRLSKSGETLAHEQVTRRPPTLDCGSTFERAAGR